MQATRLHIKCIIFLASLSLSYSKHISFDIKELKRILPQKENCKGVCSTPECVKTAARVLSDLDESVDPCDNFYRFACGGWLSSHHIPEGEDFVSVVSTLQDEINLKLEALFEINLDGTEPAFVKMLKDMYDSCMDLDTIYKLGNEPLKKDLANLGGWPVVEGSKWNESSFDWVDTLISFRRLGYNYDMLIHLSVEEDEQNKTTHIIKLHPPYIGSVNPQRLIRGLNDSETTEHYKTGVEESVLLGADVNTAEKELLKALQFKMEIAKILYEEDDEDKNDVSRMHKKNTAAETKDVITQKKIKKRVKRDGSEMYSKYTVAELQNMIPEIPWERYFNGLLNDEVRETENIAVFDPVYLKKLASLLEKTDKRVVANHMFWRIVHYAMLHDLPRRGTLLEEMNPDVNEYRHSFCFREVREELSIALYAYYVRHFFKQEIRNAVMELLKYVHREFLRILEDADWMDDVTKKVAIEKANSMKKYIGYPKEFLNDTAIMEIYENLTISNNSYYRNVLNLRKWKTDNGFSSLRKPDMKAQWLSHAMLITIVDAFYFGEENSMVIPAGILVGEYFEKTLPHYMNFGGIGVVIGHEITHGFDVDGKQYDKNGNKVDWWDKTTDELYHKRVQCMIEQYTNYTLEDGMKLNAGFTIADDIADNGGLKAAYRAYHSWVKINGPELLLPGIKYNQDQLFWINFAQTYCEKIKPEALQNDLLRNPHSPKEFRVIGPVSNLAEFSKDFSCPPDSPMSRKNKCHVW